jgi:succinate-semialdehyde dehydrogenase/glutarate-semialdehyde dehydrogenase
MIDVRALPTNLFIGGAWVPSASGRRLDVADPSTGRTIASVVDGTIEDGMAALDAAHAAFPAWAATPPRERGEVLRRAFELMTARIEWFAELISRENGKVLPDARAEVRYAVEFFRWFSEEAVRVSGDLRVAPSGTNRVLVQHQPVGVSLLITPWNFPAAMATRKIGSALAAGCPVILKPAAETPLTAIAMAGVLAEAGVPPGVVNVVTTSEPGPLAEALLADPRVRKLSFTGSTPVGRRLMAQAANQMIRCSLELGGNAPFIVFDDANLNDALDGAMVAKMRNGGEACTSANRFYIQRGLYDRFASGLAARMGALRVGPGYEEGVGCGPLISRKAVEKVDRLVRGTVAAGARALLGGAPGDGCFYPPTVLVDVPADAAILREEIFGPVAVLLPFDTADEVVRWANDTEYGLVAYLYTSDLAKGLAVAERLESGMVAVNRGLVSDPSAPFGGMKQSGQGREGAHEGLMAFLETKYIAVPW